MDGDNAAASQIQMRQMLLGRERALLTGCAAQNVIINTVISRSMNYRRAADKFHQWQVHSGGRERRNASSVCCDAGDAGGLWIAVCHRVRGRLVCDRVRASVG
jgi:hypothetical protein